MIPQGAPGSWRRFSRLEVAIWVLYRCMFSGDLKICKLRRGPFNDVCRKHCPKESGNPVLPCQAGVCVRSTGKCFLHLGSRPESSLKRNQDCKDWTRFTLPSPWETAEDYSDFPSHSPVCSSPRFVFRWFHSLRGQLFCHVLGTLMGSPWGSQSAVLSHSALDKATGSLWKNVSWALRACVGHYLRETPDRWFCQTVLVCVTVN